MNVCRSVSLRVVHRLVHPTLGRPCSRGLHCLVARPLTERLSVVVVHSSSVLFTKAIFDRGTLCSKSGSAHTHTSSGSSKETSALQDVRARGIMWTLNGEVQEGEMTAKKLLMTFPRGAYTTARTVGGGVAIFQLKFTLDRIAKSLALMHPPTPASSASTSDGSKGTDDVSAMLDPDERQRLDDRLLHIMGQGLRDYRTRHPVATDGDEACDLRITLLVTYGDDDTRGQSNDATTCTGSAPTPFTVAQKGQDDRGCRINQVKRREPDVYFHAEPMPPPPTPPIVVEVRGKARANAAAKDSAWVRHRQDIESARRPGTNELLLEDDTGHLIEGSQTNFFAVIDGTVYTAEDGILHGTVRDVVLKVCADLGIPVVLKPPKTASYATWEGAFITSTSRLVLPIDTLVMPLLDPPVEHTFSSASDDTSVAHRIAHAVLQRAQDESAPLL
eukprot:m.164162 g.164162  ORF g.164162 m.164162 type:complete len:445 (-) comp12390_c0_seq1:52-1386(-)